MERERIVIAEILRPRGNRGELLARSQTDIPGRLESLKKAQVQLSNGQDVAVEIEEVWAHRSEWVLKFTGVDSIESASKFRGGDLWVDRGDRGELAQGEYFQSDLNGCEVIESGTGKPIGVVEGWQQYGGPPLMEVATEGRTLLVPFVSAECRVDLGARTISMNVPEGLLEL